MYTYKANKLCYVKQRHPVTLPLTRRCPSHVSGTALNTAVSKMSES